MAGIGIEPLLTKGRLPAADSTRNVAKCLIPDANGPVAHRGKTEFLPHLTGASGPERSEAS